jgi:hypothetical protein
MAKYTDFIHPFIYIIFKIIPRINTYVNEYSRFVDFHGEKNQSMSNTKNE